ncbi:TPA: DUF3226 domain-containing protein [Acinetobacter nosocomialis]|uniref:DUF3226 domain-containing protein n=1 Tax=Acinetobacter TaxID=469 RepID=UPI00028D3B33|nr:MULTISPECIES: DUF3226 domain-containing protein [Acinetobacter]MDV7366722.1 DUF3226 domain-containing protein [Acinetobacter baumannii]EKF46290.1 hypothetical protein W9I_01065 [Acinetobacter nosocomialis Ab22222]EXS45740.1 hypothetical protein J660_2474 [Acinetobacter sp. 88816]MBP1505290.1 hypothetical protein [Acinetobacter nosocomialis]MBR7699111.1 hypothetical protein [Acinetobacter nosocomialis]
MKHLIVEGLGDKAFFEKYCQYYSYNVDVNVLTPEDINPDYYTTKNGVISSSLDDLIKQITLGMIKNLGIIIDADHVKDQSGIDKTKTDLSNKLQPHGYTLIETTEGIIAQHNDGLIDIGIWIMPDNREDGNIENWIEELVCQSEALLYEKAKKVVNELENENLQKFKPSRIQKAQLATWFAWQKSPGHGLDFFFHTPLIDLNHTKYTAFCNWFKRTFEIS